jgi:hypothetical protein
MNPITLLLYFFVSAFKIKPPEPFWVKEIIDDGRTLSIAWGYTEQGARERLANRANKRTFMHSSGILKVIISDTKTIPKMVQGWIDNHLGITPDSENPQSNGSDDKKS